MALKIVTKIPAKAPVDLTDTLYLHPSDQPGLSLVPEPFNGENFENWKRAVNIALSAKNKTTIINGLMERPSADSPALPHWERCNDMVLSWLLNSLHKDIRDSVNSRSASELWEDLSQRYGQSNKARLFQAIRDVSNVSQDDLDIPSYFSKAKKFWDEFAAVGAPPSCTCGGCKCDENINSKLIAYFQEQCVIQFLMGLNETYVTTRGGILMMSPFPNVSQTYSLLVQEERQRQTRSGTHFEGESASFSASNRPSNTKKWDPKKTPMFCDHCKRQGHTIDRCFHIVGFPLNNKGQNKNKTNFRSAGNAQTQKEQDITTSGSGDSANKLSVQPSLSGLNQEQ